MPEIDLSHVARESRARRGQPSKSVRDQNFDGWRNHPTESWQHAVVWPERGDDLTYFGRNGCGTCQGIVVSAYPTDETVSIQPINSKGEIARCRLDVPREALLALLAKLQQSA